MTNRRLKDTERRHSVCGSGRRGGERSSSPLKPQCNSLDRGTPDKGNLWVCPTFYTWRFLPGCTTHDANRTWCPLGCKVEPAFSLPSSLMGRKAGLVLGSEGRSLVSNRTVPLSSP